MGLPSRLALHARHRHGADRQHDPRKAPPAACRGRGRLPACLILSAAFALPASAERLRIATFNTELQRDGPGLFLRDILNGESPDIAEALARIARADADILLLQGMDFDHGLAALSAFAEALGTAGAGYPHRFALRPNTGAATGRDLDGDGRTGARDAQGFGTFAGQGGLALLSRHPVTGVADHSGFLWSDLPGTLIAPDDPGRDIQRLSSVAHWTLTVTPASGPPLYLLAFHATPPVFDGPEDRNGRRNHDEAAFWTAYLDGSLGLDPPTERYVLLGDANLDPVDGEGLPDALAALLADPRLRDPGARSAEGTSRAAADGGANARHRGDPSLDTADWRDDPGPGNLRVDYILPSADWSVVASGILWPEPGTPTDGKGSRHGLVWVDLDS